MRIPLAMFKYMVEMDNKWRKDGHMFRIWIGPFPLVFLGTAESSEVDFFIEIKNYLLFFLKSMCNNYWAVAGNIE